MDNLAYQLSETENSKEKLIAGLNENQKQVVLNYHGLCAVPAGPGAGKTKTMVVRTAYMIEDGVNPSKILMFTFTKKAANEMKERVAKQIGEKARSITISTYHSFCMRILREYAELLGWNKHFSIFDEDDKAQLLKKILKKYTDNGIKVGQAAAAISRLKENMMSPKQAEEAAGDEWAAKIIAAYYTDYAAELKRMNAFDFDDLIYMVIRLFERYPLVKAAINKRYEYITADETQDSSPRDLKLLYYLGIEPKHDTCVVFDDDQSIYGFRGVDIKEFYRFLDENGFKRYTLSQNYRSTKAIVNASNSLICNNGKRLEKKLFSENAPGARIGCVAAKSPTAEARYVANLITKLINGGYAKKDIAILYRMSYLSHDLENALLQSHIPYQIVNGMAFYNRTEIKDILSYIRFIENPLDGAAFKRALGVPNRGLGEVSIKKILESHAKTCNFFQESRADTCTILQNRDIIYGEKLHFVQVCFDEIGKYSNLRGKGKIGFQNFTAIIKQLLEFADGSTPDKILDKIVDLINYNEYVKTKLDNAEERIANIEKLKEVARSCDTLQELLEGIMMDDDNEQGEENEADKSDRVQMLTMHASKGLEWPVVIIVGASEGIIPHRFAVESGNVDEERRLFYVAMTRAKQLLFITRPESSVVQGAVTPFNESRFIGEIDQKYVQRA